MGTSDDGVRIDQRLALRISEAARVCGVSEGKFRELMPEIPCIRTGRVVLIPVDSLRDWLAERAREESASVDEIVNEIMDSVDSD